MSRRLLKARGLRDLSPPLRYLAYVAAALLAFLVSAGVGAIGAVVVGGSPEGTASGLGNTKARGTTEGTMLATTGEEATSKVASVEKTVDARDAGSHGTTPEETNPAEKADAPLKESAFI